MSGQFFLGVDGGATQCRARVRSRDGARLAESQGAAANIYVDFDKALASVAAVVAAALDKAGLKGREGAVALGVGLAGLSSPHDARQVEARFQNFARVAAANDAVVACLGAHGGADGGIVIAGTGTAAMARVNGAETVIGGRGFILGDDGSGARIGHEALRAAVRAADGIGPESAMTAAMLQKFGGDPLAAVTWAAGAKPGDFGALAPLVLDHARREDALALPIVMSAVAAIGALARAVKALGAPRVALVGGLGGALRPFFPSELQAALGEPQADATEGALLLAGLPRRALA